MRARNYANFQGLGKVTARGLIAAGVLGICLMPMPSSGEVTIEVMATGLVGPTGLAYDHDKGLLYVAEPTADRIAVIADGEVSRHIDNHWRLSETTEMPPFTTEAEKRELTKPELHSPVDVALDDKGNLFVAESAPGGRIVCLEDVDNGKSSSGHLVVVPSQGKDRAYTSVDIDHRGRIFVSSIAADTADFLPFGQIIMRDLTEQWHLVDCGPFAEFLGVSVSPNAEVMAVGEKRSLDLTWYDVERRCPVGGTESLPQIRHVAVTAEGRTLVSAVDEEGSWSLGEVSAVTSSYRSYQDGLPEIGGVAVNPTSGDLLASLVTEGKVIRMSGIPSVPASDSAFRLVKEFEASEGLPPKEWPTFFRSFIDKLGVVEPADYAGDEKTPGQDGSLALSMMDFARSVPVIAAKMKARLEEEQANEPDPIEEISFVLFDPKNENNTKHNFLPNISLFRVKLKSGKELRTRFIPLEGSAGEAKPSLMGLAIPSGFSAASEGLSEDGMVRVYFLGMGLGSDYWIDINRNDVASSTMRVEKMGGEEINYAIEPYPEDHRSGGHSVLVAEVKPVPSEWWELESRPAQYTVIMGNPDMAALRHMSEVKKMLPEDTLEEDPKKPVVFSSSKSMDIEDATDLLTRAAMNWSQDGF